MAYVATLDKRACTACHKAKRKCNKNAPCHRCKKQGLTCNYPPAKPSNFTPLGTLNQQAVEDELINFSATSNDLALSSLSPTQPLAILTDNIVSIPDIYCGSWFLAPETFLIDHSQIPIPPNFKMSDLKGFIQGLQDWFETWIKTGSNLFIHHHLYRDKLPACVQIAFTTFSAYVNRTPATADMLLRAVNDRMTELITDIEQESYDTLDVIDCIARVHALLVYLVINLLDGDPRSRHLAEQHDSVFIALLEKMLDKASTNIRQKMLESEFEDMTCAVTTPATFVRHEWEAWVISESVRRTWLLGTGFMSAYEGMKTGWTSCGGDLACTNREGLWTAESSHAWIKLCVDVDVRFIGRFRAEWLFGCPPDEVDDFAKMMLEITYGKDRMARWLET